ncbi:MAG: DUF2914 domain-containing protein [Myxococcota bacterium]
MKARFVILITLALLTALGCRDDAPKEPGPLARASADKPILTSTAQAPSSEVPPPKPTATAKEDLPVVPDRAQEDPPAELVQDNEETDFKPLHDPEPLLGSDGGLSLKRLMTAPDVEFREPVAPTALFGHHEEKVYAFIDVENTSNEEKSLDVFFISPTGRVTGGVALSIPANTPRWRTWAFTRHADESGTWRVEVRGADGILLGALPFEVAEGC